MKNALSMLALLLVITGAYADRLDQLHGGITALTETDRNSFFTAWLQRNGTRCMVKRSVFQRFSSVAVVPREALWTLYCSNGHDLLVSLRGDGSGETFNCKEITAMARTFGDMSGGCYDRK